MLVIFSSYFVHSPCLYCVKFNYLVAVDAGRVLITIIEKTRATKIHARQLLLDAVTIQQQIKIKTTGLTSTAEFEVNAQR